jgi:CDGSH-type Zn-finger protein
MHLGPRVGLVAEAADGLRGLAAAADALLTMCVCSASCDQPYCGSST